MEELSYMKNYQEYRAELGNELTRAAESFVRIGYLLKVARDTNILEESGYASVTEFAKAEFGIDKTQVSRFISINDKFAEEGYSDRLKEEYRGFGYAKLTIMLQLPDAINEELTPNYSKAEIQSIKEEVDEENKVSDIERYLEPTNELEGKLDEKDERSVMLYKAILQLGEDDPELYVSIGKRKNDNLLPILPEIMAPSGDKMYSIRVKGIGRLMLAISELSDSVKLINSRSGEKESYSWIELVTSWIDIGVFGSATEEQTPEECWEQRYERKYPIVAPVQQKKKETKVSKAPEKSKPKKKAQPKAEEKPKSAAVGQVVEGKTEETVDSGYMQEPLPPIEDQEEEQIPGQMEVDDYPELAPATGTVEKSAEEDADNIIRGYKAAVTSGLRKLNNLWIGDSETKIDQMLKVMDDVKWRLEQIKKAEEEH